MKLNAGLLLVAFMVLLTILEEINWLNVPFWIYLMLGAVYLIFDILGLNKKDVG